jgi:DNA-binding transcriptional MerR regulator
MADGLVSATTNLEIAHMVRENELDPARGVYGISVAAGLVGSAPQNLRLYEARGLLSPARSDGGTRLYSDNDLERLRVISHLLEGGLNLAGIQAVLDLQETNNRLQLELDELRRVAGPPTEEEGNRSAPRSRL